MNKEVKEKWLQALKSGEYKKGRGELRGGPNNDEYCCLGVLTDLFAKEKGLTFEQCGSYGFTGKYPPNLVYKWAEITDRDGIFLGNIERTLAQINDSSNDFSKVIERIEATTTSG